MKSVCALVVVIALAGCKEKPKQAPASPPATTGSAASPAPSPTPAPAPMADPVADPVPVVAHADAGIDAPPSKSEQALSARAEFFGRVSMMSKRAGDDCARLGAELDKLTDEARAMMAVRSELAGEHVAQDEAIVKTTFRSLTSLTSSCSDTSKIDAFLNVVGDDPR